MPEQNQPQFVSASLGLGFQRLLKQVAIDGGGVCVHADDHRLGAAFDRRLAPEGGAALEVVGIFLFSGSAHDDDHRRLAFGFFGQRIGGGNRDDQAEE
jgi:hypothetical protein